MQLASMMLLIAAKIAAPLLLTALALGLVVSLFQAVTHINDSTLGFLPRLVGVAVALYLSLPWILQELVSFTVRMFEQMEHLR